MRIAYILYNICLIYIDPYAYPLDIIISNCNSMEYCYIYIILNDIHQRIWMNIQIYYLIYQCQCDINM